MNATVRDALRREIEAQMPPLRWTPEMFRLASSVGCFEDKRVELIGGRVVAMTDDPPHLNRALNCEAALREVLPSAEWFVAREVCLALPGWTPRADVMAARGHQAPKYDDRLPGAEDLVLVVEVCDTTYLKDRRLKLPRYARAGVPACWLVNMPEGRIEVYESPRGRRYRKQIDYGDGDVIPIVIDDREAGRVPVRDVLGGA